VFRARVCENSSGSWFMDSIFFLDTIISGNVPALAPWRCEENFAMGHGDFLVF
jgi:hypothetical protein